MKITPRKLILDLLLASVNLPLSSKEVVAVCRLFGIGETSARVALTRLLADGLIKSIDRGIYQLGPNATELADGIAEWRSIDRNVRQWEGGFLTLFTATLGRVDRVALVRRERALKMMGFKELDKGLYVRPDNLEMDLSIVMQRLNSLGVESGAIIARVSSFESEVTQRIEHLWDGKFLMKNYCNLTTKLEKWMANAGQLPLDEAARDSLLIGSSAIHQVVFDPLLPEPWVDISVRNKFFQVVRRFDQIGIDIWLQLRHGNFTSNRPYSSVKA